MARKEHPSDPSHPYFHDFEDQNFMKLEQSFVHGYNYLALDTNLSAHSVQKSTPVSFEQSIQCHLVPDIGLIPQPSHCKKKKQCHLVTSK